MGRHKGGCNHKWTNDERIKYVLMCEQENFSIRYIARTYRIPRGTLDGWIRRYRNGGIDSLNPDKPHVRNRFAAIYNSKSLSELERLKLTVEKLEIENERLKKGYIVKGAGADKVFVTLNDLNFK